MVRAWAEVGDRVFVRRYPFLDQNIVVVLDRGEALLVDTRSTYPHAREIVDDLVELGSPRITVVVNTHGHYDHVFGNRVFRPALTWGHERCVTMLERDGEAMRSRAAAEMPELAADLRDVELDPPERVFATRATADVGTRSVELAYLGRGHTDNDIVVSIDDADVICAGDLVENGATPFFGDGYPLDWPDTAAALLERCGEQTVVVPGHGAPSGRRFVAESLAAFLAVAALGRRVHAGDLTIDEAVAAAPYPPALAREPLERVMAQLRGELD